MLNKPRSYCPKYKGEIMDEVCSVCLARSITRCCLFGAAASCSILET